MRKVVGLLTLDPLSTNYGGILQQYALQQAIIELGYECIILNYDPKQELNTFSFKRGMRFWNASKFKAKLKKLSTRKSNVLPEFADLYAKRIEAFTKFKDEYVNYGEKLDYNGLIEESKKYCAVVCGSDQIWNPSYNIPSFFLNFVPVGINRVIYAASLGVSRLAKIEKEEYAKLILNTDYISVREYSAVRIIEEITDKKVNKVLDPTLLINVDNWKKIANKSTYNRKDYIFYYGLHNTEEKVDAINKFSLRTNLPIISIPHMNGKFLEIDEQIVGEKLYDVGPQDFLWLILNARYVITDSFHASVFSILFEKNFYVFKRGNMNTRLDSLLGMFGVTDRFIDEAKLEKIDITDNVKRNLLIYVKEKEDSFKYLKDSLTAGK